MLYCVGGGAGGFSVYLDKGYLYAEYMATLLHLSNSTKTCLIFLFFPTWSKMKHDRLPCLRILSTYSVFYAPRVVSWNLRFSDMRYRYIAKSRAPLQAGTRQIQASCGPSSGWSFFVGLKSLGNLKQTRGLVLAGSRYLIFSDMDGFSMFFQTGRCLAASARYDWSLRRGRP